MNSAFSCSPVRYAIASRSWYLALESHYLWTLKDYIDRSFMRKFNDLPEMKGPLSIETSLRKAGIHDGPLMRGGLGGGDPMRCGGCGSKVNLGVLKRGELDRLSFYFPK